MVTRFASQWSGAGVFGGPAAWAINTQANYALASWFCPDRSYVLLLIGIVLAAIAVGSGVLSWLSQRQPAITPISRSSEAGEPRHLLATVGLLCGILFALVILTQTAAGLFLSGCER
jgi:hypothetical protein